MTRARWVALFGMIALSPAAVGAAPHAADGRTVTVPLCSGDGIVRSMTMPLGHGDVPGAEQPGCCAKGCHNGGARKRGKGGKEPRRS
jgi:hypothetical protein